MAYRILLIAGVAWVVVSPSLWRWSLVDRFGVEIPWSFSWRPLTLAVLAITGSAFLWARNRRVGLLVSSSAAIITISAAFGPVVYRGGTVMNGLIIAALSFPAATLRRPRSKFRWSGP